MLSGQNLQGQLKLKTGRYTGDGNDNRNINIGIDLNQVQQYLILIKLHNTQYAVYQTNEFSGDSSSYLTVGSIVADRIQGITSTGFQIGTATVVNANGILADYVVFYQE